MNRLDLRNLVMLVVLNAAVGGYLLATAVLISRDGVSYIWYAQALIQHPIEAICGPAPFSQYYMPGYPALIAGVHGIGELFGSGGSPQSWIWAAQVVALACRLLVTVPLYFLTRDLLGRRAALWGLIVLAMLPAPAHFGSDALRDWPGQFFLVTGFWALLRALRSGGWSLFLAAGVTAGAGYVISPAVGQLVFCALLWAGWRMVRPGPAAHDTRRGVLWRTAVLAGGFLLLAGPCMLIKYKVFPTLCGRELALGGIAGPYVAFLAATNMGKSLHALAKSLGEMLMYYWMLPLGVGVAAYWRGKSEPRGRFLLAAFLITYLLMLVARHRFFGATLSVRYALPLVAVCSGFIGEGLWVGTDWILRAAKRSNAGATLRRTIFAVLLVAGLAAMSYKLVQPLHADKAAYVQAAQWLRWNTPPGSLIAVPDTRIGFLADRPMETVEGSGFPRHCRYVVKVYDPDQHHMVSAEFPAEQVIPMGGPKDKVLIIYRVIQLDGSDSHTAGS